MSFSFLLRMHHATPRKTLRAAARRSAGRFRPFLETLEDRSLPSGVSFSPPVNYPIGPGPISMAVGDFDGDGNLDLAVTNQNSNTINVLLGNGDGTFQPARYFTAGRNPTGVVVGEFDGDSKPDLAVTNLNGGTVTVLLGNGDGTFQAARNFATGGAPESAAVGEFDGDGKPDLAVANLNSNTVSVLLGNGDGTFQTAQNFAAGPWPVSAAVGEFDGDGKPDLAVTNLDSNTVSVLLGNGDGTFQAARNFAAGPWPLSVAVGEFDGDSKPDLAVTNTNGGTVSVLLGNGDGTFQAARNFATGGAPESVAVGEFDGDGKPDLAVANYAIGSGNVVVLLGNGDGTFQTAQNFATGVGPIPVAIGDFNGDGRLDLATGNHYDSTVSVLLDARVTTTAVSGPTSSTYGQSVSYTATVSSGVAPVTDGSVTFLDGSTALSPPLALDANGQARFSIATLPPGSHTITVSYSGTQGGAGTTGFGPSTATLGLTINPATLSAAAVNFSATAGAPFSGTVATFANADPFGNAASYTATITWGDGSTTLGSITGAGTLTVSGAHTYADPGSYAATVRISHNLGCTTTATVSPAASVTSLGLGVQRGLTGDIGFWHEATGQALINSFNGGLNTTGLGTWLANNFHNLYWFLSGNTNAQVAAFYQYLFALTGPNAQAEVLATALNVYTTTQSLGGTAGLAYGFTVTAAGLGAYSFNVGPNGDAFGMSNNSTHSVYAFLRAVDQNSWVFFNPTLAKEVNDLLDALNKAGRI